MVCLGLFLSAILAFLPRQNKSDNASDRPGDGESNGDLVCRGEPFAPRALASGCPATAVVDAYASIADGDG